MRPGRSTRRSLGAAKLEAAQASEAAQVCEISAKLALVVLLALASSLACSRPNPLYHGPGEAGAGGTTGSAGIGGQSGDAPPDAAAGTTGSAGTTGAGGCTIAGDCTAARGAAPCGAWQCKSGQCALACPNCVDMDGDGYGVGAGCLGPDCADDDPAIGSSGTRSCYDGPAATAAVGECRAGRRSCQDGVWATLCTGEVLPSGEACNGLDDDCDGQVDDGLGTITCGLGTCAQTVPACANGATGVCKPGTPALAETCGDGKDNDCNGVADEGCDGFCVHVAPNGDDQSAGTTLRPFRTIQAAIDFAAGAPARPKNVCVAGGDSCFATNTYAGSDANALTMANGVSVYGNYEATTWSRCSFGASGLPNLTVSIAPRTATGVVFPATVTSPTTLDGVRVVRANINGGGPGPGGGASTIAAITVSGAKQVQISNVVIDDAQGAMITYGVNLTGGAEALITRSAIFGGTGSTSAIGVHSQGSKPTIRDNCASIDPTTGRCVATCGPTSLGLHGRSPVAGQGQGVNDSAEAVAVDLAASPGAIVERNAICGTTSGAAAGVRVAGLATGVVIRGNGIAADGGSMQALGVSLLACGDAAPWIVGNALLSGEVTGQATRAAGVNAVGACHPIIDGNAKIVTGTAGMPTSAFGVFCGPDATSASRCVVANNALVQGSPTARPAQSFGVACDAAACARVSGNTLLGGNGATVVGLSLRATGAFVDRNTITGGCGGKSTTGVLADDAASRVENNVVHGAECAGAAAGTPVADGLRVHVGAASNEADVNSNTIDSGGSGACQGTAAGIGLGNGAGAKGARGIFRDNILGAGTCAQGRVDFIETNAGTAPRLFEHNDLDPTGTPTWLYQRFGAPTPPTIAAINLFPGSSGNISAAPLFVGSDDYHLDARSPCVNAGTTAGAPKIDFDGKARDDHPDIGAFEH